MYNVVFVSGVEQGDSIICIHVSILLKIFSHLLQNIEKTFSHLF